MCAIQIAERINITSELDPWLSIKAAASYSSLSVRTIRNALKDPTRPLPHYRPIGAKIVIRRSELDLWVKASRVRPDIDRLVDEVVAAFCPSPKA